MGFKLLTYVPNAFYGSSLSYTPVNLHHWYSELRKKYGLVTGISEPITADVPSVKFLDKVKPAHEPPVLYD